MLYVIWYIVLWHSVSCCVLLFCVFCYVLCIMIMVCVVCWYDVVWHDISIHPPNHPPILNGFPCSEGKTRILSLAWPSVPALSHTILYTPTMLAFFQFYKQNHVPTYHRDRRGFPRPETMPQPKPSPFALSVPIPLSDSQPLKQCECHYELLQCWASLLRVPIRLRDVLLLGD